MKDYVIVGLREERFAFPITEIQEIIRMQAITDIPARRASVRGIINLRGAIVPVVDLGAMLRFPPGELDDAARIVIVNRGTEPIGLLVDRVDRVFSFQEIVPPPTAQRFETQSLLAGIGKSDQTLVPILDLEAVLSEGGAAS